MKVLDCGSWELALATSASVLGIAPGQLKKSLQRFEFDALPEAQRHSAPYEDLLVCHITSLRRHELPIPDVVHWFHGTRLTAGTDFREGPLPLSAVLDRVWEMLGNLALEWSTPGEWMDFRRNMSGLGTNQYHRRLDSSADQGPGGVLVREVLFRHAEMCNHDYLGIPEIVEDICLSYREKYERPLRERYLAATEPCIVKYRSDIPRPDVVSAALLYVHRVVRGEELCRACNSCYFGDGVPIGFDSIIALERGL